MGPFLASPIGSWIRVFVAVVLGALLIDLQQGTGVVWQTYAIAGAVSVIPLVIAWLNPSDPRFGRGST